MDANRPFIFPFKSICGDNCILDIHTNRLFFLDKQETKIINSWLDGQNIDSLHSLYPKKVNRIKKYQESGLFNVKKPQKLKFGINWNKIRYEILNKRMITIIEITEKCNLKCKYCTYNGGFVDHVIHGSKTMNNEMLTKTIDASINHSRKSKEIFFTYYGGEPLIEYNLMKEGVEYTSDKVKDKKVHFSVTTNATLINNSVANFLRQNNFSILVSIDGPKELHNQCRIFPNGKGSYKKTIEGLKCLISSYSNDMQKLGLNMVIPSIEWIPYLEKLWMDEPWLPKSIRAQANLVDPPQGFEYPKSPPLERFDNYHKSWLSSLSDKHDHSLKIKKDTFEKSLIRLHHRYQCNGYREYFFPNGCCIPGSRRVFVRVNGIYHTCERAHGLPPIGSVNEGINFNVIKKIINEYCNKSFEDCKKCYVISNCRLCFVHAYEKCKFNLLKKRNLCNIERANFESNLSIYSYIYKNYPHTLQEWDNIEIT